MSIPISKEQPLSPEEQFIKQCIFEKLAPVLAQAQGVIEAMTDPLERGTFTLKEVEQWQGDMEDVWHEALMVLRLLIPEAAKVLGGEGALAMTEIAHHVPKFFHFILLEQAKALSGALLREQTDEVQACRGRMLTELGGSNPTSPQVRWEHLQKQYSVTPSGLLSYFQVARKAVEEPESFLYIHDQVEKHFKITSDKLQKIDPSPPSFPRITLEFDHNLPDEQEHTQIIPRGGLIVHILDELVTNALKVMHKHRTGSAIAVQLTYDQRRNAVTLLVRDDGPGCDPDTLFHHLQSDTAEYGGTGAGLGLWKELLYTQFNGLLKAVRNDDDDDVSPGMTFFCILPGQGTTLRRELTAEDRSNT